MEIDLPFDKVKMSCLVMQRYLSGNYDEPCHVWFPSTVTVVTCPVVLQVDVKKATPKSEQGFGGGFGGRGGGFGGRGGGFGGGRGGAPGGRGGGKGLSTTVHRLSVFILTVASPIGAVGIRAKVTTQTDHSISILGQVVLFVQMKLI